jgi:hypothetical protein
MDKIKDSFGVHLWNKQSKNMTVNAGSQQPYSLLAVRACPRMYAVCGGYLWRRRDASRRSDTAAIFLLCKYDDKWQLQRNAVSERRSYLWHTSAVSATWT